MSPTDNCLTQEMILGYLKKDLDPDELALTEAHLTHCELCEAAVEGIRLYLADHTGEMLSSTLFELRDRISERKDPDISVITREDRWFASRKMWTTIGIAASILILVGIGTAINYLIRQRNMEIAQAEIQQKGEPKKDRTEIQYLPSPKDQIFNDVEESPAFPGGDKALSKYLAEKISCPSNPAEPSNQTNLFVHFVVEEDGSISNVRLVREMGDGCAEEAIRGIESMPRWTPGKNGGETVRVGYILMLKFS